MRRRRDSNPRYLAVRRFSRPVQSTTLPLLRRKSTSFCSIGKKDLYQKSKKLCVDEPYRISYLYRLESTTHMKGVHNSSIEALPPLNDAHCCSMPYGISPGSSEPQNISTFQKKADISWKHTSILGKFRGTLQEK